MPPYIQMPPTHPYAQTPPHMSQCSPVHIYVLGGICTFIVVHYVSSLYFHVYTTTPTVTVVSSGMSSLSSVTMAPSFDGASYNSGSA